MTAGLVPVVLVHGGAGDVSEARRAAHVEGARRGAIAGREVLAAGGSALDAVQRAVEVLEDDPLFNAGTGACLTETGTIELDASIMDGATLRAGAVAALPPYLHPIAVARAVLEDGRHVLYAADGADAFARAQGFTPATLEQLCTDDAKRRLALVLAGGADSGWAGGTVGAVACDARGRTAAATSTGGTVGKKPGRIGDTPLIGAGTYADDEAGAASATGKGEAIMRVTLTRHAIDLLRSGRSPEEAARASVDMLAARAAGATGGIILVGPDGRVGHARNTTTMSWAAARVGTEVDAGF
jgi:beta-aspartyl-peptidase (threonine type)